VMFCRIFFVSSRRRHTRSKRDWSSDVCSSDLAQPVLRGRAPRDVTSRAHLEVDLHALLQGWSAPDAAQDRLRTEYLAHAATHERSEERRVGKEWRAGGGGGDVTRKRARIGSRE